MSYEVTSPQKTASTTGAAIKASQLSKTYEIFENPRDRFWAIASHGRWNGGKAFWALRNVSMEVQRGETYGVVGRNGAGKSTLLQVICGVLAPSSGNVSVTGRITALLELGAGLNLEFDGVENIRMTAAILGLSSDELEEKLPQIIEFAQLGDFIRRPVKLYSSGMVMRLAFSAAINFDPDILVIDEALAVGDELFQSKCLRRIQRIKEGGATVLFVSHSMHAVNQICDRALLLENGEAIFEGAARSATERYNRLLFGMPEVEPTVSPETSAPFQQPSMYWFENPNVPSPLQIGTIKRAGITNAGRSQTLEFHQDESVTFLAQVEFLRSTTDLILGMMIATPTGVDCYHTNTLCRGETIAHAHAGETFESRFQMRLALAPGSYVAIFDCQCEMATAPKLVDIMYEAFHFRILPTRLVEDGGIAMLAADVSWRHLSREGQQHE